MVHHFAPRGFFQALFQGYPILFRQGFIIPGRLRQKSAEGVLRALPEKLQVALRRRHFRIRKLIDEGVEHLSSSHG